MWTRAKRSLYDRLSRWGSPHQIYIIPTFDALKLLALNLTLLIVGLVYANNFVLFFNFVLFCLFLSSMYYTHFNLRGLELLFAKAQVTHAAEEGKLSLVFLSRSELGHFFLSARLSSNSHLKLDEHFLFSIKECNRRIQIDIPYRGLKRGRVKVERITIETLFPFHLFRCLVVAPVNLELTIYPEKKNLNVHQTIPVIDDKKSEGEDYELKNYMLGDSLKRVHWKKVAQTNQWFTKSIISPRLEPVVLTLADREENIENQLSSMAFALYTLQQHHVDYGVKLGNKEIAPGQSSHHFHSCLKALAEYESKY